jgi:hypothetical protein
MQRVSIDTQVSVKPWFDCMAVTRTARCPKAAKFYFRTRSEMRAQKVSRVSNSTTQNQGGLKAEAQHPGFQ